jgi:hypothetical protein
MINISVTKSVLQVKNGRLPEVGRCHVMEIDVERTKIMRISRHPFPVQIMIKNNWRV